MSGFDRYRRTREAVLYTLAYFDAIDYAPTWTEVSSWLEWSGAHGLELESPPSSEELRSARDHLISEQAIESGFGRLALPERLAPLAALAFERTTLFNRKIRRARRVARWLLRFPSVRFIALANTTALANARDEGDLDFFIVVRDGRLWSTRLMAVGALRVTGGLVGAGARKDPACMSYMIADTAPDLAPHMLAGDDVYFRYWFLSLLPLYDDGIGRVLWDANATVRAKHPRARAWIPAPDLAVRRPLIRFPMPSAFESFARKIQMSWFPPSIKDRMNRDTTVIVNDRTMKFHVDDGRETYRTAYNERLRGLGLI
jgi:hypothetical protein